MVSRPAPVLSGRIFCFATESMLCCSGRTLPETLKLLAPLANLEALSLSGSKLGGTITAEVAAFTKVKKLELSRMGLIRISPFSPFSAEFPKEFGKLCQFDLFRCAAEFSARSARPLNTRLSGFVFP